MERTFVWGCVGGLVDAQQAANGDVLVEFFPMDAITAANDLPFAKLFGRGVEKAREVGKRCGDLSAIRQLNPQRVLVERYTDSGTIEFDHVRSS